MSISAVIPCYNHGHLISDAIESVRHQVDEVIIVDDCSGDRSYFDSIFVDHIVSLDENKGTGYALNRGIEKADGDFILMLDADDIVSENFVEVLKDRADVASCWVKEFGYKNRVRKFVPTPIYDDFLRRNQMCNMSLFDKNVWNGVGGFREDLEALQDWDFWLRASKMGFTFNIAQRVLAYYRKHDVNSRNATGKRFYNELSERIKYGS